MTAIDLFAAVTPFSEAQRSRRAMLRAQLAGGRARLMRLPESLEQEYAAHHHALALDNLRTFWPLVVLAVLAIAAITALSGIVDAAMTGLVTTGFAVMFAAIAVVVAAALVPALNDSLEMLVGLAAFAGLLAMHVATLLAAEGHPLRPMAEFGVVFITLATCSIANLMFRRALLLCVAAMLGLILLSTLSGVSPSWQRFPFYALGSLLVASIVGLTQEMRERTVFLQGELLALEKQELDALTQELAQLSREDALTGLANRRAFDEVLEREWNACLREGTTLNLAFIDVDHFKLYNDHYGHQAGDECLARVGRALGRQAMRSADFVARYGGEEFVAMFPRTSQDGMEVIARRIVDCIDELAIPHVKSTAAPQVTVSVGVASLLPQRGLGREQLVKAADEALYRAKQAGRHRYEATWGA